MKLTIIEYCSLAGIARIRFYISPEAPDWLEKLQQAGLRPYIWLEELKVFILHKRIKFVGCFQCFGWHP